MKIEVEGRSYGAGDLRIRVNPQGEPLPEDQQFNQPEATIVGFGPHAQIVKWLQEQMTLTREEFTANYPNDVLASIATKPDAKVYYTLYDLDGNGQPELLVGARQGEGLYDIFTTQGSNFQSVVPYYYDLHRSLLFLHDDGAIEVRHFRTGGKIESDYYRLQANGYDYEAVDASQGRELDLTTLHWFRLLPAAMNKDDEAVGLVPDFPYPGNLVPETTYLGENDGFKFKVSPRGLGVSGSFTSGDGATIRYIQSEGDLILTLPNDESIRGRRTTQPTVEITVSDRGQRRNVRVNTQVDLTEHPGFGHATDAYLFYNKYGTVSLVIFDGVNYIEYLLD